MKQEKLIVGLILTIVGIGLLFYGYQKMQPDNIEKGLDMINDLSKSFTGQQIPQIYHKDNTDAIIILIIGGVFSVLGIGFILKNGKQ